MKDDLRTNDAPRISDRAAADELGAPEAPAAEPRRGARAAGEPIVVKKYANRRLYNTATSSYVTLENLAAMVRDGQDFVVQDARTGEDITRAVLTQVIFEEEARGHEPMLPIAFLRQLIRLYGHALQGYVPGYLEMAMVSFERNQETFRSHMERSFGSTPGFAQFDAMTRANIDIFRKALEMFATFASSAAPTVDGVTPVRAAVAGEEDRSARPPADARRRAEEAEIDAMRRQLADMQKKIDALVGPR